MRSKCCLASNDLSRISLFGGVRFIPKVGLSKRHHCTRGAVIMGHHKLEWHLPWCP